MEKGGPSIENVGTDAGILSLETDMAFRHGFDNGFRDGLPRPHRAHAMPYGLEERAARIPAPTPRRTRTREVGAASPLPLATGW